MSPNNTDRVIVGHADDAMRQDLPDDNVRQEITRLTRELNAQWPAERSAAVELARSRDQLAALPKGVDENVVAGFQYNVALREGQARVLLGLLGENEHVSPTRARGRSALAGMLDPDPDPDPDRDVRAAARTDALERWPADHRNLMLRRAALLRKHPLVAPPNRTRTAHVAAVPAPARPRRGAAPTAGDGR